ncbi:DUF4238 domain-containing protein (plasmid) [Rhizobium ruizarguesonis]|uniref:DUF4238 domain-containing protein n=1 Tax=Rhizobium ruizarguesonis TaxID=2081791 RepID=UPI00102FF13E|nr:DUF4238 domain-containing protein [Rhizobium ruizarguesonis]TBB60060.1 DUF4238 domain-containing protein [Rhizobium ruizarguesonis]
MSQPKRHHYVPRFLLANFVNTNGKLWVRRAKAPSVWSASPENTFLERHRYSSIDDQGNYDTELEQTYSALEGAAKPIVDKFIDCGRAQTVPTISPTEKATWDQFCYQQMKRVPEVTNQLAMRLPWAERLEQAISQAVEMGITADQAILDEVRSPEGLARIRQNATVKALAAESKVIMAMLAAANYEIGITSGDEFVVGSRPIAMASHGLADAEAGKTTMWFPLASDVAVRPRFSGTSSTRRLSTKEVSEINEHIIRQSEYVAGASESLLKSLPVLT